MRNTLGDLNNHLFEQLERLNDEDLSNEELEKEINRAQAMNGIARNVISNASLVLQAQKLQIEALGRNPEMPKLLEG